MPIFTSSIELSDDYPSIQPSLNLNFARARALDPRITFTRASVGTYVGRDGLIKTAGENEARFDHDPETLESLGLLIEESRTNSITYSQPTSDVSFGSSATKTFNAATAPNGKTEAFRITHNGSSGNSNWRATRSITFSADAMVLSVWAKGEGSNNYFVWSFQGLGGAIVRAGFKLEGDGETSIMTSGNGGHTLQIEKYPDGWYRCIIIGNTQSSGGTTQFLYTANAYSESASTSGSSVLLWGFQLEVGSFATSYIPTSAAAVTRAVDLGVINGTSFTDFFNYNEGTFSTKVRTNGYNPTSYPRPFMFALQSSPGADFWQLVLNNSGQNFFTETRENTGTPRSTSAVSRAAGEDVIVTSAVKNGEGLTSYYGSSIRTNVGGSLSPVIDSLLLNQYNYNGTISKLVYYPKRLTDAQLQLLTS